MNPSTLPPTAGQKASEKDKGMKIPPPNPPGSLGSVLEEVNEPKPKKKREFPPVGIREQISVPQHGVVEKPLRDGSGKELEFESTAEADKWLLENAKEGDSDKVFLIAPLRRRTIKAVKQLKITMES